LKLKIAVALAVLVLCGIILTAVLYPLLKPASVHAAQAAASPSVSASSARVMPRMHDLPAHSSSSVQAVQFTITAMCEGAGSISPAGAVRVNPGDDITFTITEVRGKTFTLEVLVNGEDLGMITSYTFTNVQSDQSIRAVFQ
jgi:protein involved in polysaccharide export with SLBB domain